METTASMKTTELRLGIAAAVILGLYVPAQGADIEAGIELGISYTDNALLATSPDEVDDFVYRTSPFINYTHESPGLDASLRYRYEWYRYEDLAESTSYHMGEGSLTGKFWEEALAIEVGANRKQVLREPDQNIPPGSLPVSGNLLDRDDVYINPRLQRKLGRSVNLNADYRYSEGSYDDPELQDDTNQDGQFLLENYDAGEGLTWALRYDWQRTEYEIAPPWENQRASLELGFWAGPTTRIFALGGQESPWDEPLNPSLEDTFWEAGFAYKPSENLSAEFAAGERSFGTSGRGKLDYTFRRGTTSLSYVETPTTTGYNQGGARQSALNPDDLDEFLDTPGRPERYLSKRLQWDLNIEGRRTAFGLELFDEDRSGRTFADGTSAEDQAQSGVSANFTWQAGVRTEFVAFGSILRREFGSESRSDYYGAGIGANYRIGTRTQLSLDYSYNEQQPEGSNPGTQDYVANVISLFFTYTM